MHKNHIALMFVSALAVVMLACNLPAVFISTPTPTPGPTSTPRPTPTLRPSPMPTTALPPVTLAPLAEPANVLEAQVEAVYDRAGPAVVHITSRVITYDVFMRPVPQEGTGSGFIYDTEGHIVTNYHVVAGAESVSVALAAGGVYTATVVGADSSNDLAVLRIEAENLPDPIPLGDSDQLRDAGGGHGGGDPRA